MQNAYWLDGSNKEGESSSPGLPPRPADRTKLEALVPSDLAPLVPHPYQAPKVPTAFQRRQWGLEAAEKGIRFEIVARLRWAEWLRQQASIELAHAQDDWLEATDHAW